MSAITFSPVTRLLVTYKSTARTNWDMCLYLMVNPQIPITNQCPRIGLGDFSGVHARKSIRIMIDDRLRLVSG